MKLRSALHSTYQVHVRLHQNQCSEEINISFDRNGLTWNLAKIRQRIIACKTDIIALAFLIVDNL